MTRVADLFVAALVPFLLIGLATLAVMLLFLVAQRMTDELQFRRRRTLTARYRHAVDVLLGPDPDVSALVELTQVPPSHLPVIEAMLLKPLAVSTGSVVERLREAARATGLVEQWVKRLSSRLWWIRADSARALGLVREDRSIKMLVKALDDDHEEVRAAAVEALGLIGDPQAIPVLLARLTDQSRNQRARIIEALRQFGDVATPALLQHANDCEEDAAVIADVFGLIGGPIAGAELKKWMVSPRSDVRTAAMRALGTIGLDDLGVIVALQALDDPQPSVRAMAARAIGRTQRQEDAVYLAQHLDDEWNVAASCADALRRMGAKGFQLLQRRSREEGYVGDLARQMLWERRVAESA